MERIIGISGRLAAIEGRAIIGRERNAVPNPRRQIRIGNKMSAERDRIRMSRRDRGLG